MQRYNLFSSPASLLVGAIALACSSGGGSSGGDTFSTGVDPSKNLDELTPAEADASCEKLAAEIDRIFARDTIVRSGCILFGLEYGSTTSECQDLAAQCEDFLSEEDKDEIAQNKPVVECDGEPGPITACPITVAQYDRCVNDTLGEFRRQFAAISCTHAASVSNASEAADTIPDYEQPASCEELEELCPGDDEGFVLGGRIVDGADEDDDGTPTESDSSSGVTPAPEH